MSADWAMVWITVVYVIATCVICYFNYQSAKANQEHKKAEYGIFIGEDTAVGKGFGSEAARLAVDYGFEELGLHKIFVRAFADNAGAIRTVIYAVVMTALYFLSYMIQQRWVFAAQK